MAEAQSRKAVLDRLRSVRARPSTIGVSAFRESGTLAENTANDRSNVASYQVRSATAIRQGPSNPFRIAIPAYETKTAAGGAPETINLSNDLIKCPITEDVVVFLDGVYSPGAVDSIDYANNSVDVNTAAGDEVDVFYIAGDPASMEVQKEAPQSQGTTSERLFNGNLNLIHSTDQAEQPEFYGLNRSPLQSTLPTDWKLAVYVDAPYSIEWSVDRTGGTAQPVNALLGTPVRVAPQEIEGLGALVRQDIAGR